MSKSARPQPAVPYIICMDLHDQEVCVVGGGEVASRKVESLLEAGATVHLIAPDVCDPLRKRLADHSLAVQIIWHAGPYTRNLPAGVRLVVACTDNRDVNRQVRDDCHICGVLCNVVDDPELCDFTLPATRRIGRVQIAVSTGGSSPSLARELADDLAVHAPPEIGALAELLSEIRLEVRTQIVDTGRRKELHDMLCSEESLRALRTSGKDGWRQWYQQQLARFRD